MTEIQRQNLEEIPETAMVATEMLITSTANLMDFVETACHASGHGDQTLIVQIFVGWIVLVATFAMFKMILETANVLFKFIGRIQMAILVRFFPKIAASLKSFIRIILPKTAPAT